MEFSTGRTNLSSYCLVFIYFFYENITLNLLKSSVALVFNPDLIFERTGKGKEKKKEKKNLKLANWELNNSEEQKLSIGNGVKNIGR